MADNVDGGSTTVLPPITVARFEEIGRLIEQLLAEKTSVYAEHATRYRQEYRERSRRPLTPYETGQLAAAMSQSLEGSDPSVALKAVDEGGYTAVDEPPSTEVLVAAGIATAPAFIDSVKRLAVLVEMPADKFEAAREGGTLSAAIDEGAKEWDRLDIQDARERAKAILEHVSTRIGGDPKALTGQLGRMLLQAMTQATADMGFTSLINSVLDTDGVEETSSTEPPTASALS